MATRYLAKASITGVNITEAKTRAMPTKGRAAGVAGCAVSWIVMTLRGSRKAWRREGELDERGERARVSQGKEWWRGQHGIDGCRVPFQQWP